MSVYLFGKRIKSHSDFVGPCVAKRLIYCCCICCFTNKSGSAIGRVVLLKECQQSTTKALFPERGDTEWITARVNVRQPFDHNLDRDYRTRSNSITASCVCVSLRKVCAYPEFTPAAADYYFIEPQRIDLPRLGIWECFRRPFRHFRGSTSGACRV